MASLLGNAIIALCVSASGQYNQACNKALDAGTRQVGIRQDADALEDKSLDLAKITATKNLGPAPVAVATAGVYTYRVYKEKSIVFKLPNMGIADTISNQITDKSYKLNFEWRW